MAQPEQRAGLQEIENPPEWSVGGVGVQAKIANGSHP